MSEIKTVGIVGSGVIGAGWAARCLARGYNVIATDPGPGAEEIMASKIANAWPALIKIGWAKTPVPPAFAFTTDLEEVGRTADFIQENAPDRLDIKQSIFETLDRVSRPDVILASSSSGLLPSDIQDACTHPERIIIGHPFNPSYLLPLCEVVGGGKTSQEAKERAGEFYKTLGMHVLQVRKEVDGYLSDRLQEAIWREILHMVKDGVATTQELDEAIIYGPGLRWALMGVNMTFTLAGGEAGMRHMLEHFGPALELPWTHLKAPELTEELIDRMVEGTTEQTKGRTIQEWEQIRDNCLIDIMRTLRPHDIASGKTMNDDENVQLNVDAERWKSGDTIPAPLEQYAGTVLPGWVDYNGHMNEAAYLEACGWAADKLFRYVGIDEDYRAAGKSVFTVETHINYIKEVRVGEEFRISVQLLGVDDKRFHFFHQMYHRQTGDLLCTAEQLLVHVDLNKSSACPFEPQIKEAIEAVVAAHASLETPANVGRQMMTKG
jgi:carnitine 3-dehydrogenase